MQLVLIHNIGHHDLYLASGGDADGNGVRALLRPNRLRMRDASQALRAHLDGRGSAAGWLDGRGLQLDPPLATRLEGAPADRVFAPLLAAALDHVEPLLVAEPNAQLTVFLVSAGPEDAANTPVGFGPMLASIAAARWRARGLADRASARPVHLPGDAFDLDAADLHVRLGVPIVALAAAAAEAAPTSWRTDFRVFLSASTGTAAMISGLVAAASRWHPQVLAVPNARHEPRLEDGVLVGHRVQVRAASLVEGGARVALADGQLDAAASLAVTSLRAWRDDFLARRPSRPEPSTAEEEGHFWFRKGRKEVLATLVVRRDGALRAIRGVNLEVSLPTGTLCAERNAIGTAVTEDPSLERADIEAVAVVGLGRGVLGPCGACQEWLRKVAEVNPRFQVLVFDGPDMGQAYLEPLSPGGGG